MNQYQLCRFMMIIWWFMMIIWRFMLLMVTYIPGFQSHFNEMSATNNIDLTDKLWDFTQHPPPWRKGRMGSNVAIPNSPVEKKSLGCVSKPIIIIVSGMNTHLPAILTFTRYQGFDRFLRVGDQWVSRTCHDLSLMIAVETGHGSWDLKLVFEKL